VLDGGYAKWSAEGRVVSTDPTQPTPATFDIARVTPTVNATGVMASIPRQGLLILDARAAERYRGETEPFDPVAGHIPGARNRPHTQNLNADGTFKEPAFLRAEFGAILDGVPHDQVVHQCGSGVTACHNILAMEIAGLTGTRLYPGDVVAGPTGGVVGDIRAGAVVEVEVGGIGVLTQRVARAHGVGE